MSRVEGGRGAGNSPAQRQVRSCGVLLFRREPELSFLLLRVHHRIDLPKGHVEAGETDEVCAFRELAEETGLTAEDIVLDRRFRFVSVYHPHYRRYGGGVVEKTVVIFLGWLQRDLPITLTEHADFQWVRWTPPHHFGHPTIDGALAEAARLLGPNLEG